ncbi:MAG: glycosyltransferase [Alphaproteobacteria bacterium]
MAGPPRLLFHVQHLLGIGHLRRAALLAQGLVRGGFAVTVAQGGEPSAPFGFGGAEVVQLPPLRSAGSDFGGLVDAAGRPLDAAGEAARRDALLALFDRVKPDIVLLESFPFGRRQMRFELVPLLQRIAASRPRPRVAVSIRDILQRRKPERERETAALVAAHVDRVLVHGDPSLVRLEESFGAADRIADRIAYTGYVAPPAPAPRPRDGVIVSAGGGAVGAALLRAALDARAMPRQGALPWTLLTGPNLPATDFDRLCAASAAGVTVARAVPDLAAALAGAVVSVSQAGYNTVMDIAVSGVPAVLVPFAGSGETEQPMRAARLATLGLVAVVDEAGLTPRSLADAIDAAAAHPTHWPDLALDGAAVSACLLRECVHG